MTETLLPWLSNLLILLGIFIMTVAVYGMVRMPDIYTRLHAASKSVFLSVFPFLLTAVLTGEQAIAARAVLVAVFLILTTPVATHAIGRAAYLMREPMETPEAVDESGRLPRA